MSSLWNSKDEPHWRSVLNRYEEIIRKQGSERLPALDAWYRRELPDLLARRDPVHVTRDELVRITEWKMARGVWRARNLVLVRRNPAPDVLQSSSKALSAVPDPKKPIAELSRLGGVGPATASAVAAAAAPAVYPFFDHLVAAQVPDLGPVVYTLRYYAQYADALRERASRLGGDWTPVLVERALWANAGGKAGSG